MKVTIHQIFAAAPALQKLASLPMPGLAAFFLARMVQKVQPELEAAAKARDALITKYGEAGQVRMDSPNWPAFLAEMQPLLDQEIEIDVQPFGFDPKTLEAMTLSAADMLGAAPFVDMVDLA